ncbi:MAG TPA: TlpA disulfide reductase family protein [Anaerolineales bacterium]
MENQPRVRRPASSLYLMLIGLGLILTGAAAILLLGRPASASNTSSEILTIPAEVSYAAPELSLKDLKGNPASLADLRGQVVLVNLWATWCPPCKEEMPTLQAYYERHKDQGFVIVAINDGDPQQDVSKFVNDYRLTFPVWLDPTYIATDQAFKTSNLPSSFVIDREGVVRLRWVGGITETPLETYVTPLIEE